MGLNIQQRIQALRRHRIPIIVWLIAILIIMWNLFNQERRYEVLGMTSAGLQEVAATQRGRIKDVKVKLFQQVKAGDLLTVLHDEQLRAALVTARFEISQLSSELAATRARFRIDEGNRQTDAASTRRRFEVDVDTARLRMLELQATLEPNRIRLHELELEKQASLVLVEKGLISDIEREKTILKHQTLTRSIAENEALLERARIDLTQAQNRLRNLAGDERPPFDQSLDQALAVTRMEIQVQEARIAELELKRAASELTAPYDGVIVEIKAQIGDVVLPGQTILVLAKETPEEIVSYATETWSDQVRTGKVVELVKYSNPKRVTTVQITAVGSIITEVPERLRAHPKRPQMGKPFLIEVPQELGLLPGEVVGIRGL